MQQLFVSWRFTGIISATGKHHLSIMGHSESKCHSVRKIGEGTLILLLPPQKKLGWEAAGDHEVRALAVEGNNEDVHQLIFSKQDQV